VLRRRETLAPGRPFTPPLLPALSGMLALPALGEGSSSPVRVSGSPQSATSFWGDQATPPSRSVSTWGVLDGAPSTPQQDSVAAGPGSAVSKRTPQRVYHHATVAVPHETLHLPNGVSLETFGELLQWWYTGQISVRGRAGGCWCEAE
jgi:hypothetical protein